MRGLILLWVLLLSGVAAEAAGRKTKKSRARKKPPSAAKVEPKKAAREAPPASVAAAPAKKPAGWDVRTALSLGAGGYFGGGANRGPVVGATATFTPALAGRRFSLDVDLTWRMAGFRAPIEGYGTLTSTLHSFPLLPAVRFRALEVGRLILDVRAGVGPSVLLHVLSSDFGAGSTRTALGWEAFGAVQARVPVAAVEVLAEVRAGVGEAHVPFVLGKAVGAQALLGVRYGLQ